MLVYKFGTFIKSQDIKALKGLCYGDFADFGRNYIPETGGCQRNPFRKLSLNISKGRYNLNSQGEKKPRPLILIFFEDAWKHVKSLASIFQVAIRFHPRHLLPKTIANCFSVQM